MRTSCPRWHRSSEPWEGSSVSSAKQHALCPPALPESLRERPGLASREATRTSHLEARLIRQLQEAERVREFLCVYVCREHTDNLLGTGAESVDNLCDITVSDMLYLGMPL